MMYASRFLRLAAALSFAALLPAASYATSSGEHGGKDKHYEVPLPKTKDEAVTLLKTNLEKINAALAKSDFHAIHEATYSVESAIARIAKEKGYDGLASTVAPRVEIVHLASELEDAETLKTSVPALMTAVNGQLAALLK